MVFDARAAGISVLERLDHAPADADVALAPQRLARIEHVAALDDEVELVVRPHRGMGLSRCGGDGRRPLTLRKSRRENPVIATLPPICFFVRR